MLLCFSAPSSTCRNLSADPKALGETQARAADHCQLLYQWLASLHSLHVPLLKEQLWEFCELNDKTQREINLKMFP